MPECPHKSVTQRPLVEGVFIWVCDWCGQEFKPMAAGDEPRTVNIQEPAAKGE